MRTRLLLGVAGVALAVFGVYRLVTQIPTTDLIGLAVWLVLAVAIHDGVLSPAVFAVGWLLNRLVPHGRASIAGGLIVGGLITVIAVPLIYRQGSQPPDKAILRQSYTSNLTVLLGLVAAVSLLVYAVRVAHAHRSRPGHADDQASASVDGSP